MLSALCASQISSNFPQKLKRKGNILLCDYKLMDVVQTNTINAKKQQLVAPLVLLQKNPDNKLIPVAFRVSLAFRYSKCYILSYSLN